MLKCSYSGVLCSNKGLIKEPTYFKNLDRPTGIDLILKNHPKCFQHSVTYETKLSDFHKLTYTALKMYDPKHQLKFVKLAVTRSLLTINSEEI